MIICMYVHKYVYFIHINFLYLAQKRFESTLNLKLTKKEKIKSLKNDKRRSIIFNNNYKYYLIYFFYLLR